VKEPIVYAHASQPCTFTRLRHAFFLLTEHAVWRSRPTMEAAMIGMLGALTHPPSKTTPVQH
jgi:hypothetical protein